MNAPTNQQNFAIASGGTRVPRVVFGVSPKTPARAMERNAAFASAVAEVSGGTPETTRETRVAPDIT